MPRVRLYNLYAKEYDSWYDNNSHIYETEINAVKKFIPKKGTGIDIGTGTGRFAYPFGITIAIEPSSAMRDIATKRGIKAIDAVAEDLPLPDKSFDFALMITVTCFLDDLPKAFAEAHRILKPKGSLIIAHIDKNSYLGKMYGEESPDPFLKEATLFKTRTILGFLRKGGFIHPEIKQTLFEKYAAQNIIQPVENGFGSGAFVVIKIIKS